ncbi:MAG: hypothetical protein IPN68_14350 [Bacteroidetes bacterium]|nr:hypothetical protein [Bacteroidota bacterium]
MAIEWDGQPTNSEKVRRTLEINLVAPYAITEALVPLLSLSDDARVINQSSQLGSIDAAEKMWQYISGFMTVGYATSKAGLMLTRFTSVRDCSCHHPGWVKTDLGTDAAPMEVEEGASTVVSLVTIARDQFPHGQLVHKGERIPW